MLASVHIAVNETEDGLRSNEKPWSHAFSTSRVYSKACR